MVLYDYVIGIDPDVEVNGVAFVDKRGVCYDTMTFAETEEYLKRWRDYARNDGGRLMVFIEAGWLNKSNWHVSRNMPSHYSAAIGVKVGQNQGVGKCLLNVCEYHDIPCQAVEPLSKTIKVNGVRYNRWRGKDGKITAEELSRVLEYNNLPPIKRRTNQDQRDAILIALCGAGYILAK